MPNVKMSRQYLHAMQIFFIGLDVVVDKTKIFAWGQKFVWNLLGVFYEVTYLNLLPTFQLKFDLYTTNNSAPT